MSFVQNHQQAAGVLKGAHQIFTVSHNFATRGDETIEDIRRLSGSLLGSGAPNPAMVAKSRLASDLLQNVAILVGLSKEMMSPDLNIKLIRQTAKIESGKAPLVKAIALADAYLTQVEDWSWYLRECDRLHKAINAPGWHGVGYTSFFGAYVPNALSVWREQQRLHFGPPQPATGTPARFRGYRPLTPAPMGGRPAPAAPLPPKPAVPEIDLFADD